MTKKQQCTPTNAKRLRLTPRLLSMYAADCTTAEIEAALDISRHAIRNWLDKAGVERRSLETVPAGANNQERLAFGSGPQDPETGCIPWTRGTDERGYGKLAPNDERRNVGAHRLALELKLGRRLGPGEVCRHSCDRPGCIAPDHLSVGSTQDNSEDMYSRGRSHAQKRFNSPEQVALREKAFTLLATGLTREAVARELGVRGDTVCKWVDKCDKGHLVANGPPPLTEDDVREIRRAHAAGESYSALAKRFERHRSSITNIVKRLVYAGVT